MAGSLPGIANTQRVGSDGKPLVGGLLSLFQANTTTPVTPYSDFNLTLDMPNPITLDAYGQIPPFFLPDGFYRAQLTDATASVILFDIKQTPAVGVAGDESTPPTVDTTTQFQTGDYKHREDTSAHDGWVPANGETIGSASSGASGRANPDCQLLFTHLWNKRSDLTVSGGRGANAAADWAANKNIALPDLRGRTLAGLDDMGNTAAERLTSANFGSDPTDLGATGGEESHVLTVAELPTHTPAGTVAITDSGHTHGSNAPSGLSGGNTGQFGGSGFWLAGNAGSATINSATTGITAAFTGTSAGSDDPHSSMQPTSLCTIFIKL